MEFREGAHTIGSRGFQHPLWAFFSAFLKLRFLYKNRPTLRMLPVGTIYFCQQNFKGKVENAKKIGLLMGDPKAT
jgi:hypothetical protein